MYAPSIRLTATAVAVVLVGLAPRLASSQLPSESAGIDRVFSAWTAQSPGCAVGVQQSDLAVLMRAYGLADLEHRAANTPTTIFEAGSVAKQFTAAAVLLLVRDGKLSLDDSVRRYLPELPDYGVPLTIRHLLMHTSGLRDWGGVVAIGGQPRGTRVFAQADVLDITSRQRSLNFTPGTKWSYTNTGYNLAAIIVTRVSQMSFADFTRTRIFEPLGMTRTSWRDDFTRLVPDRALAYARKADGFHLAMPFENAYGNGGLLTTVEDLLRWNRNFDEPVVGDRAFVAAEQEPGSLSDGTSHGYAFGLAIGRYEGFREVGHDGATAGYSADLLRFPDRRLSVAVLCNADAADASAYAHQVADLFLADQSPTDRHEVPSYVLTAAEASGAAGLYRNTETGVPMRLVATGSGIRIDRGPALIAVDAAAFRLDDVRFELTASGSLRVVDPNGRTVVYERMALVTPTVGQLADLRGTYVSDEAESALVVGANGAQLEIRRRPDTVLPLTPLWQDAFSNAELGTVVFRRDDRQRVTALSVITERVWDLRFRKDSGPKVQ